MLNCTPAHRRHRNARFAAVAAALTVGFATSAGRAAEVAPWPSAVQATYDVHYIGIDIGKFVLSSETSGSEYKATGQAKISLAFGALSWRATAVSTGKIEQDGPDPAKHSFHFKRNSKSGSVEMTFARGRVEHLNVQPDRGPDPRRVPVEPHHMQGVYDPMSAILAVTRATRASDPCQRKVGVFDGKQRMDLEFSFKRTETIKEASAIDQPRKGYVCKVRYIPVAGHKINDGEVSKIAGSGDIEVVFQHIPSAGLFIPTLVRVPTPVGTAALVARSIDITTDRQERIAFRH